MHSLLSIRLTKIFLAVVVCLLVIGYAAWSWQHPQRINITRDQYDIALATWQAQNVEEYEITTDTHSFLGGVLTLHVTDHGNTVEELAPNLRLLDALSEEDINFLKRDTIEGMFARLDKILTENAALDTRGVRANNSDGYMAYKVIFDPIRGYPKYMEGLPVGPLPSDVDWRETVTSLKIIKKGN